MKELNATVLVLIPKSLGADSLNLFRPINLCKSFYKIIPKVLTSRILKVLPLVISSQQTGFVLGRKILDSIMMVHKVIHSLEARNREGFLLKMDPSKAYDRVDWGFLKLFFGPLVLMTRYAKLSFNWFLLLPLLLWSMVLP